MATILDLPERVAALPADRRHRFERLFQVHRSQGELSPPPEMEGWIERHFGSVQAVRSQTIVKVTNRVTGEGALFNPLRGRRPTPSRREGAGAPVATYPPFRQPLRLTPADPFGRVHGRHCLTASNVAKADGFHGVLIFDEPDPLRFSREAVHDYVATALAWARQAHATDPQARYFFFLWNSHWKAGASVAHGHAQMLLGRGAHYARIEGLRRAALAYRQTHGYSYFDDLVAAHADLGLRFREGEVQGLAYLTPIKEKEVLLLAPALTEALVDALYEVLRRFVDRLGVRAFNVALIGPPLFPGAPEDWSGFPTLFRLVDRGDPASPTTDFGAMELYAQSVIASDPFAVARQMGGLDRAPGGSAVQA